WEAPATPAERGDMAPMGDEVPHVQHKIRGKVKRLWTKHLIPFLIGVLIGILLGTTATILIWRNGSPPSSEQQAQSVIVRYYTAINNTDYLAAYNLWAHQERSYQDFSNNFADTKHDVYTFGPVSQQGNGTVQVNLTLVVTSTSSQQKTYQGY